MRKLLIASMLGLGLAGAAFAQPGPGPGPGPDGPGHGPMMEGWHHPGPRGMEGGMFGGPGAAGDRMACAIHYGRQNEMLARLHDRLKITTAQDGAWKTFTADVNADLAPLGATCHTDEAAAPPPAPTSLPDRLAALEQRATLRTSVLGKVRQAVATMYAQLTPEQKQMVDNMGRRGPRAMPPGHPPMPRHPAPPPPPAPQQ